MNNKPICSMRLAQAFILLALLLAAPMPTTFAQNQLWLRQFGTSEADITFGAASDGAGGVMITGYTYGSLGGPNAGVKDVFLVHYDESGTQLWIRQFGTRTYDRGLAIATDGAGGVIVGGVTRGSMGGPGTGGWDVFLARYDHAGKQLWIRQFDASHDGRNLSVAPDGAGGVIVAGPTTGSPGGPNVGNFDIFLARYDRAGNQLWIRQFGTNNRDNALALASDGSSGAFVGGWTSGSLGGPNAGLYTSDAFLARYDGEGNRIWIRQFGADDNDQVISLALDGVGGVMVSGAISGTVGGPNAGLSSAFLARYDEAGNRLWMREFDETQYDWPEAATADGEGGVVIVGTKWRNLGTPLPDRGPFVARYDRSGNRLWFQPLGSSGRPWPASITLDRAGNVVVAGTTTDSLGGPNAGGIDAFLARYEIDSCYADCDQSTGAGVLDMLDFLCFQHNFMVGNSYACDCDTSTGQLVCDIFDFLCFQNSFVGGCP